MSKFTARWKLWLGVMILAVATLWGWRNWQGPIVSGYVLESAPLLQHVVATGRVVANSRAQIGSEITAVVTERRVREGDRVKKGDILAILRADSIKARVDEARAALELLQTSQRPQAKAALARAESQLAQAQRELGRRESLLASRAVTQEIVEQAANAVATARAVAQQARLDVQALAEGGVQETILQERLRAAQADLDKTILRAEKDGAILTRNVEPGDLVQPGRVLFTLSAENDTELLVPVDERNLGVLATGQKAIAITDAWPDHPFNAVITSIAPAVDPERGTVDVRLAPETLPDFLRQDLTVTVTITTGTRDAALVVPNDALQRRTDGQTEVWRVDNGTLERVPVKTGLRGQNLTEVVEGLDAGDTVARVSSAVQPGQRVRLSPQPMPGLPRNDAGSTRGETPMKFN